MLTQSSGGSGACMSRASVRHPIAGIIASLPMVTREGLEACRRDLPDVCFRVLHRSNLEPDTCADAIGVLAQGGASDAAPALVERAG